MRQADTLDIFLLQDLQWEITQFPYFNLKLEIELFLFLTWQ